MHLKNLVSFKGIDSPITACPELRLLLAIGDAVRTAGLGYGKVVRLLGEVLDAHECAIFTSRECKKSNKSVLRSAIDHFHPHCSSLTCDVMPKRNSRGQRSITVSREDRFLMSVRREGVGKDSVIGVLRMDCAKPFGAKDEALLVAVHSILPFGGDDARAIEIPSLAPREIQILDLLTTGCSEKEIAELIGISVHTVHVYVKRVYLAFKVHSRAELMNCVLARRRD